MLREDLKKKLDALNEEKLEEVASFIASLDVQSRQFTSPSPFWQRATSGERARDFRTWISQLPKTGVSLPDEAFSRETIYNDDLSA
jgi:hypothetical protein